MLQINPKRFKTIQNKTIPSPLRPKFRNKNETNPVTLYKIVSVLLSASVERFSVSRMRDFLHQACTIQNLPNFTDFFFVSTTATTTKKALGKQS